LLAKLRFLRGRGGVFWLWRAVRMDAKLLLLREKLGGLLSEAARVAAQVQALEQGSQTPHFDQIELPAHELGRRLSRMVLSERSREVAAEGLADAACPTCGAQCMVAAQTREVHSMDGPLDLAETVAHCRRCRRSFFPSASRARS
jgi:hypothetical protein